MAVGLSEVNAETLDAAGATSHAFGNLVTPAIGDVVWVGGNNGQGTNATLTGGGMTWTRRHLQLHDSTTDAWGALFEATAGTPSAGVLTVGADANFADPWLIHARPTDCVYNAIVGSGSAEGAGNLTVNITGSGFTMLAGFAAVPAITKTFTLDPGGWVQVGDGSTSVGAGHSTCQAEYRTSDDTEWVPDINGTGTIIAIVASFAATGSAHELDASVSGQSATEATVYRVAQVDMGQVTGQSSVSAEIQLQKPLTATVSGVSDVLVASASTYQLTATVSAQSTTEAPTSPIRTLDALVSATSSVSAPTSVFLYRDAEATGIGEATVAMSAVYALTASVGGASATELTPTVVLGTTVVRGAYAAEHARAYREVKRAAGG